MAAISSTIGMQAAAQSGLQQLRLQQARQIAERAEMRARNLQQQAAQAQKEADRAQERARNLAVQADQAQETAGQAKQGLAMMRTASEMVKRLGNTAAQVGARLEGITKSVPAEKSVLHVGPVVNLAGQVTGTLVNTTA